MGRKGTSKRKKAKQKAIPAAEGDSGSSVLKAINQPEKIIRMGKSKAPPKGNKKH